MKKYRRLKERAFKIASVILTGFAWTLLLAIIIGLIFKSSTLFKTEGALKMLTTSIWNPDNGQFGLLPFIMGTVWVTFLSLLLAVPFCLLAGVYLSEYAPDWFRNFFRPIIDLLAGIPSVIYGLWGIIIIVPFIKNRLAPLFGVSTTGYSALAAAVVLAVMIAPLIINITMEVLKSVPREIQEAALALGADKWQSVKIKVFRKGLGGIVAGIVLAISRAFGETMAVLMVAGNVANMPGSVFEPAYPLPALIANGYGELMSVPLYESAPMFASFMLMLVVLFFNILSRFILKKIEEKTA